ncbi:hypothetical protein E4U44_008620 [Claviceps purpurea]|nr:hypothetical protein E4U44_008620 [Claviceps purpurea]
MSESREVLLYQQPRKNLRVAAREQRFSFILTIFFRSRLGPPTPQGFVSTLGKNYGYTAGQEVNNRWHFATPNPGPMLGSHGTAPNALCLLCDSHSTVAEIISAEVTTNAPIKQQ